VYEEHSKKNQGVDCEASALNLGTCSAHSIVT
jgi:hypothetical protein